MSSHVVSKGGTFHFSSLMKTCLNCFLYPPTLLLSNHQAARLLRAAAGTTKAWKNARNCTARKAARLKNDRKPPGKKPEPKPLDSLVMFLTFGESRKIPPITSTRPPPLILSQWNWRALIMTDDGSPSLTGVNFGGSEKKKKRKRAPPAHRRPPILINVTFM